MITIKPTGFTAFSGIKRKPLFTFKFVTTVRRAIFASTQKTRPARFYALDIKLFQQSSGCSAFLTFLSLFLYSFSCLLNTLNMARNNVKTSIDCFWESCRNRNVLLKRCFKSLWSDLSKPSRRLVWAFKSNVSKRYSAHIKRISYIICLKTFCSCW